MSIHQYQIGEEFESSFEQKLPKLPHHAFSIDAYRVAWSFAAQKYGTEQWPRAVVDFVFFYAWTPREWCIPIHTSHFQYLYRSRLPF
jgi:hypothetical protein